MGRRGPAKKPTALKISQGQRKRDLPKSEIAPPEEESPQPKFELSPVGQKVFDEVSAKLHALGLLKNLDFQTFSRYCDLFDKLLIYKKEVEQEPMMMITTKSGTNYVPNPAMKTYLAISEKLLRIEKEFGMTPASRASIGAGALPAGESEKDKLKKKLYG